ncbi:MAG: T9SS type A sorting domain-containing protein, partial [Bacteroidota bacterium]
TDGGATWNVVDYHLIMANHASHMEFTNDNNIRYCMHMDPISSAYIPKKSIDAWATWNTMPGDPTTGNGAWFTVANPQNFNQVIVTDYSNFYFSNNGGTTFGASFYNNSAGAYIAGTFWDGNNIYICTDKGLVTSTNGGTTWNNTPTMPGIATTEQIVNFAGAKTGNVTRFFCITWSSGNVYPGCVGSDAIYYQKVYSMDYGASNWIPKINGITASTDNPFCVAMATNNINVAYIAGENNSTGAPIVLKTIDSGATWTHIFNTANNQNIKTGYCGQGGDFQWTWPQYIYGISVAATDPNKAIFTDMGFTSKTTDGGATWQGAYVPAADLNPANATTPTRHYYHGNGIEPTASWDLMWKDATHIFAGYTDIHALRSNDGGNTWGFDYTGLNNYNTTYKFVNDPTHNAIYAATSSVHDMYESTRLADAQLDAGTGAVMMSTDGGATFTTMHNFGKPVIWLTLDPTSPTRMYASVINHVGSGSAGGIWVCNDIQNGATSTWTHCTNPPNTEGHPFNIRVLNDGSLVLSYSGRRAPAFTASSGVFSSADHGTTWVDKTDAGMKYWTMDLVIDPYDATQNTWYSCVFSGWGGPPNGLGGLYRTTNRGTSWTRINAQDRVYSITFDPTHSGQAYMTTETNGLWFTTNINAATPTFTQVAGYPFRQPNRVYFNPYNTNQVWVNSFGNGLRIGMIGSDVKEHSSIENNLLIYPNPANDKVSVHFSTGDNSQVNISISNLGGQVVYQENNKNNTGVYDHIISLDKQPKGIYFITITTAKETLTRKIVLQ